MSTIGARGKVFRILLIVTVRGGRVEVTETGFRGDGVLTGPSKAFAVLVGPAYEEVKDRCLKLVEIAPIEEVVHNTAVATATTATTTATTTAA